MQRHYWIASLVIGLSAITQVCSGDYWGRLVKINNNTPYTAKVISSDTKGVITSKTGSSFNIKEITDVSDIGSMNLAIPHKGWDGNQDIEIYLYDGNTLLGYYTVADRDGSITIWWIKGYYAPNAEHVLNLSKYANSDTNVTITISGVGTSGLTATEAPNN